MEVWPVSIEKLNNGEYLLIKFDDKSYMSGRHFDIDLSFLGLLSASAEFGQSFSFENNKRFNYAHTSNEFIYIMSGTCENF